MTPSLHLRQGREASLLRRHPWVFSGAVAGFDGDPQPGDAVLVRSARGDALGWATFSPSSQIRARMWTFDPDRVIDAALVGERIEAAVQRRRVWLEDQAPQRLVFSESDGLPGLVADRYGSTVVVQLGTTGADRWRETIADTLAALPGVDSVVERSDLDSRSREGLEPVEGLLRGPDPGTVVVDEGRFRYSVEVTTGHKTGFYLDQRHARRLLETISAGRRVLNVCSYTGAFSVIAAASGAESVASIDSSQPALAQQRVNADLNGVEVGEQIQGDAFVELRKLRDRARQYDLIILDPPKLAATERHLDKATRAYKDLNLLACKLAAPGALLLTFSCSGAMRMELFQKVVAGAASDAGRDASVIGRLHQPEDHPVPLAFPEAEYLKGLILQIA